MSHKWIDFEDHILDFATDTLLPLMRGKHGFDAEMATRFTNRNAVTAYHILKNIAGDKAKTVPGFSEIAAQVSGMSVRFSCKSEGTSIEWDLGDGSTAAGSTMTHDYRSPGTYLVSATSPRSEGTQNTKWSLVTVGDEQ